MYKSRKCTSCDKTFKNSASLATHKHRYHPYSPRKSTKGDDEIFSVISDLSITSPLGDIEDNNY